MIDKVIGYRQSITMLESTMNKLFCKPAKSAFLKKNNIFAIVNIAKVSSYGDFYEFCFLFSQVM